MNLRVAAAGAFAVMLAAGTAGAQCLSAAGWKAAAKPAAWTPTSGTARLLRASAGQELVNPFAQIVGMWHVHLVSGAVSGADGVPLPPVGVEIDAGFQQWHSDGTEMLNSGRPAANTNFCMGVWEQTGPRTYKLNHVAISYTQGPPANPEAGPTNILTGPTSITEEVTVSPDGKTFTGKFTIMDYKETDPPNVAAPTLTWLDTISGMVTGTRIEANTPISPIF